MSWSQVSVDSITVDSAFGPRFSGACYTEEGNVATLRTTDLSVDGVISLETMPEANVEEEKFSNHYLQVGDLVISRSGRIGTTAIFNGYHKPVLPGAFLIRFRLDTSKASPLFYRYFFNSVEGQQLLHSVARGAAQQNINITNVRNLFIPLPPLETQELIAEILSCYSDLIENNHRRIQLLEESARLLYQEWFVYLRFPGHEQVKITDGVPEGWEPTLVPDVIDVNPRTPVEKGKEIWYVPMSSLSETAMTANTADFERRTKHTNVKFKKNDVLLARITPCLENGKTGYAYFLAEDEVACGSTEFIVLRGNRIPSEFVYCLARSYPFRENAIKSMTGSSGRQRVQNSCFDKYAVPLPPKSILDEFVQVVQNNFDQIRNLMAQNAKLAQARDLLLPKLMSGELTV
ncbi:restriction endonuclease subunit S [Pseudomaricurvus alcaniphilus]|uniref:restriction endonuclease subunit S n=1 Tax=Pseudomaricurvus alcaniphilus TaxID=1166482 RepID=UPI00140E4E51|nr:restriction endonuclease subunit S [Pseudomaricurvus alcaniphilus]NHN37085.1 restriction endonuclease subunit S [Pseudomaricurvus alcaniphilus]